MLITGVMLDGGIVTIHFSGAIVWNGVDVPGEFKVFTSDGFFDSPIDVVDVGPDWMSVEFNGSVAEFAPWEMDGPMAGITPDVMYPQAGSVEA